MTIRLKAPDRQVNKEATRTRLIKCTIEVYATGNDRRARAQAVLAEVSSGVFTVTPFYLREISGTHVPWTTPPKGEPIDSPPLILTINEAQRALVCWASRTLAASGTSDR